MPIDQTQNAVRQDLQSSVGTNDPETIDVQNAAEFADPTAGRGQYNCVLWDASLGRPDEDPDLEIVRVQSRDTNNDTLTVARGQEDTTNTSHPSSAAIIATQTAGFHDDIASAFNELADFTASPTELTAPYNGPSVSTEEQNNTRIAEPGNIQSKLNEVGNLSDVGYDAGKTRGLVKVKPNTIYDPGSTLTVPIGVTLDASDALFAPSTDYDGVFLDNAARAYVYSIAERSTYSSRIVYIDTTEATRSGYVGGQQGSPIGGAYASVCHWGDPNNNLVNSNDPTAGGETAAMIDSAGTGISVVPWDIHSAQAGTAFRYHVASGGYVNTEINMTSRGIHHTTVRHTGNSSEAGRVTIRGENVTGQEYGLHNESGSDLSMTLYGALWDVGNAAQYAIAGPNIDVHLSAGGRPPSDWTGNGYTDGSNAIIVTQWKDRGLQVYDGEDDSDVRQVYNNSRMQIDVNGNDTVWVEDSRILFWQNVDIGDQLIERPGGYEMRSSAPTNTPNDGVYMDDGTNTSDGSPGWRYTTDGGNSWSDVN